MAIKELRDNLKRLKDSDPIEIAGQLNNWIQESGESLRLRIEDEVEKAVTKRGFVKKSEFQKLEARIAALEGKPVRKTKTNNSGDAVKSAANKPARKSEKPTKKRVQRKVMKRSGK